MPFGLLRDGTYRGPHEVARGLACECLCPECGRRLVAKQGAVITWHFAHESESAGGLHVGGCGEGMVHRLAKEVLLDSKDKVIHVPTVKAHMIGQSRGLHRFALRECATEAWLTGVPRRVDVLASTHVYRDPWPEHGIERVSRAGGPLIIEINVAHQKDAAYVEDVVRAGISAIEITLTVEDVLQELGKRQGDVLSAIKRLVLGPRSANRRWLHFNASLLG